MGTVTIIQHNMKNIINTILVLLVTITITKGEREEKEEREDIQDIVREMLVEMRETNAKVASMEQEMKDMNDTFGKELDNRDALIAKLQNPPYSYFCGYQGDTHLYSATIPYEYLFSSSTNTNAIMDVETGIFTSGYGGTYTASWGMRSDDEAGDNAVQIYLRKNGAIMYESRTWSWYYGPSGGVQDLASRTILVQLERGDTLDLWCEECTAYVRSITFCVSLSSVN